MSRYRNFLIKKPSMVSIVALIFLCVFFSTYTVQASWTGSADQSIYTRGEREKGEEAETEKAGSFEKKVSGLVRNIASGLQKLLVENDCDLDYIICGRVNSGGEGTALFTFELHEKNIYGVISSIVYNMLSGMTMVVLACILFGKFVKAMFSSGNGQARSELKNYVLTFGISYSFLFLMPYIVDVALYIRDVYLYAILTGLSGYTGELGLVSGMKATAEETLLFSDALVYLGTVCISMFFAFNYIGVAMGMMVLFISFSFVSVLMNYDKSVFGNWWKNFFSMMITPVVDMTLMGIPALIEIVSPGHPIIKMLVCSIIIPSRMLLKSYLGLASPAEGIMNGMKAFMAMGFMARAASGIGNFAKRAGGKIKDGASDYKNAKHNERMAEAEKEDEQELLDTYAQERVLENAGVFNGGFGFSDGMQGLPEGNGETMGTGHYTKNGTGMEGSMPHGMDGAGDPVNTMEDYANTARGGYDVLADENMMHQENTAFLKQRNAKLNGQIAKWEREDEAAGAAHHRGDILAAKEEIAENNAHIARNDGLMAQNKNHMARIDRQLKGLSGMGRAGMGKAQGNAGGLGRNQLEAMKESANLKNFDTPEYSNILSYDEKAAFYKKRAKKQIFSGTAQAAGGLAGAAAGATLGLGATVYGGMGAKTMGVAGGAAVGGFAGEASGLLAYQGVKGAAHLAKLGGSTVRNLKRTSIVNAAMGYSPDNKVETNIKDNVVEDVPAGGTAGDTLNVTDIEREVRVVASQQPGSGGMSKHQDMGKQHRQKIIKDANAYMKHPSTQQVLQSYVDEISSPSSVKMEYYASGVKQKIYNEALRKGETDLNKSMGHFRKELSSKVHDDIMGELDKSSAALHVEGAREEVSRRVKAVSDRVAKKYDDYAIWGDDL